MSNRRLRNSDTSLSVQDIYLEGVQVRLDDFKQTILLDGNPIVMPGSNQFVVLPTEIGLQPPNYFASVPYSGLGLYEEYVSSTYRATGWSAFLGRSGVGPAHLSSGLSGVPIYSPLTGDLYLRSTSDPAIRTTIAAFSIDSGRFVNSGTFPEATISGGYILGWNIYSGLSGAQDFSVVLNGRYQDLYSGNIGDGVVLSSGDSAISFYAQNGSTGNAVLEYFTANEFVATRWGVYASQTGSGPANLLYNSPLSGRFYYRDPKGTGTTTICSFSLDSGAYASYDVISDVAIPFRQIIGVDIYRSLSSLSNLNIVLGGKTITSANYYQDLVTKQMFAIFSGDAGRLQFSDQAAVGGNSFFLTGDAGMMLSFTGDGSITGIVGPNSLYPFRIGDSLRILQSGVGSVSISGSGCSVNSLGDKKSIAGQYGVATLAYKGNDIWFLFGDLM